jgi:hypothetical protein
LNCGEYRSIPARQLVENRAIVKTGLFHRQGSAKFVEHLLERVMIGSQLLSVISTLSRRRLIRIRARAVPQHSVTCSSVLGKRSHVRAYLTATHVMHDKPRRMFWF